MVHQDERKRLTLGISGFRYEDLHRPEGLARLHDAFWLEIAKLDAALHRDYESYRSCLGEGMKPTEVSDLLVRLASYVGYFVGRLFGVMGECGQQFDATRHELETVFVFRAEIVAKLDEHFKGDATHEWNATAACSALDLLVRCGFPGLAKNDEEGRVATAASRLLLWA